MPESQGRNVFKKWPLWDTINHVTSTILAEPEREDHCPPTSGHILQPSWQPLFSETLVSLLWFRLPDTILYPSLSSSQVLPRDLWNSVSWITSLPTFLASSLNTLSTPGLTGICFPQRTPVVGEATHCPHPHPSNTEGRQCLLVPCWHFLILSPLTLYKPPVLQGHAVVLLTILHLPTVITKAVL